MKQKILGHSRRNGSVQCGTWRGQRTEETVRTWQEKAPGRFIGGAFLGEDGMHAGWPYITETIALMYVYPELYALVSSWHPGRGYISALVVLPQRR